MYEEALRRLRDAETLAGALPFDAQSDSPYLLRLLGLELLLKFIYEHTLSRSGGGHDYHILFGELPQYMQEKLLKLAGERIGPSRLSTDHISVLREWGKNFVAMRYPWERYSGLTEEQYSKLGERWVERGAKIEAATYRYYPEEMVGFLAAMGKVADDLANSSLHTDASCR